MLLHRSPRLALKSLAALMAGVLPAQDAFFPEGQDRVVVPLRHLDRGQPGWLVAIDLEIGGETRAFVLDTGAGHNVVERSLSRRLEMKPVLEVDVRSSGDAKTSKMVNLPSFSFGGMTEEGHRGVELRLRPLLGTHTVPVGGILGMPFFVLHPVTIDLDRETVTIHQQGSFEPPEGARVLRFELMAATPTIRVGLGDRRPVRFMVDTGCGMGLILYPRHVERLGLLGTSHDYYEASGPGEDVEMYSALVDRFTVGDMLVRDASVGLMVKAHERGLAADPTRAGMLGSAVLWRFNPTFDYRHKRLYLAERTGEPGPWAQSYGLVLGPDDDLVEIRRVLDDGPAARAGLAKDDIVVAIDGREVGGDINGANQWLRRTTRTTLTLRRGDEVRTVALEREPLLRPLRWPE